MEWVCWSSINCQNVNTLELCIRYRTTKKHLFKLCQVTCECGVDVDDNAEVTRNKSSTSKQTKGKRNIKDCTCTGQSEGKLFKIALNKCLVSRGTKKNVRQNICSQTAALFEMRFYYRVSEHNMRDEQVCYQQ